MNKLVQWMLILIIFLLAMLKPQDDTIIIENPYPPYEPTTLYK